MIEEAVLSIITNEYQYMENVTIILATEARAPDAESHAKKIIASHGEKIHIVNILHPSQLPDEGKVK